MKRPIFMTAILSLTLAVSSLHAQFMLDDVMSKEDQQKTGVATLSAKQKIALEAWLNKNFVLKQQEQNVATPTLSLAININNGKKLVLSDNSIWEVAPSDVPTSSVWITPFPIKITPSNDPNYPFLLTNVNDGVSVKARKSTSGTQA